MANDDEAAELREQVLVAHRELLRRDEAFRAWDHEVAQLRSELDSTKAQIEQLQATIGTMKNTRAWRLAERWWAVRARLARRSGSS